MDEIDARSLTAESNPLTTAGVREIASDLTCLAQSIVNLYFVGPQNAGDRKWALVDAGLPLSARQIANAAAYRFGRDSRPAAIFLTHGHFDHVGGLPALAEFWDVPVYAHRLELPYIMGRSSYPPPDPTVGGGAMSLLSPLYPRGPIDLGQRARSLPDDHSIPGLPDWRWIPTPGHSPGHVAFFREYDRTLLAGDAFVTTRQESAIAALVKWPRVSRPPAYYTCDWQSARESVQLLMSLDPYLAATGHGIPIQGESLRSGLASLIHNWDASVPRAGRYVQQAALTDENGIVELPPVPVASYAMATAGIAGLMLGVWLASRGQGEIHNVE